MTTAGLAGGEKGRAKRRNPQGAGTGCEARGRTFPSSYESRLFAVGLEPRGRAAWNTSAHNRLKGRMRVSGPASRGKSFEVPKQLVWDAWLKVKENGGAGLGSTV